MPSFTDAVEKILKHEGGYVDHPNDKGGKTNFGITQKVYETFIGRKLTDAEAGTVMKNMPRGNAIAIYKKNYWDVVKGDQLKSYAIAVMLFDQAVNRGHVSAIKQAQGILGLVQDGIAGPKFIQAVNGLLLVKGKEKEFSDKYLSASKVFYQTLAKNNPTQAVFLNGWLKRVSSLQEYVNSNMTTVAVGGVGLIALLFLGLYVVNQMNKPQTA
jgi:lysozyme family protein